MRIAATSDRHRLPRIKCSQVPNSVCPFSFYSIAHAAVRNSTPSGTSPVVTRRHSAISSLRASATIIVVLRAPLGPSVRQYMNGARFDFETMRLLGVALEMARCALRNEERGEATIIAKHIIALAQAGERDADRLCDYALAKLRQADGHSSQLFQSSSEARAAALKTVVGLSFEKGRQGYRARRDPILNRRGRRVARAFIRSR